MKAQIGQRRRIARPVGFLSWPVEDRLEAGDVVEVLCLDEENDLVGIFLAEEPMRGGADLARGIGGWWVRESALHPYEVVSLPVAPTAPSMPGPGGSGAPDLLYLSEEALQLLLTFPPSPKSRRLCSQMQFAINRARCAQRRSR